MSPQLMRPFALDRTALLVGPPGVGEVGPYVQPHVDLARLAGGKLAPVGIEHLDYSPLDRPPTVPGCASHSSLVQNTTGPVSVPP